MMFFSVIYNFIVLNFVKIIIIDLKGFFSVILFDGRLELISFF